VILKCVSAGLLQQCIEMAPHGGKLSPWCEQPDSVFFGLVKELKIQFAIAYTRDGFDTCVAMLGEGTHRRLACDGDEIVSLDGMPAAFEALRTPSHKCKV
jgi:(R,R)-butanediol dehydrogenase/meso-butanediol dehydrogenase/diacetyl reductase